MPLILLGLILILGIAAYWYFGNQNSDDPMDIRDLREDVSRAFGDKARDIGDDIKKAARKRAGIFEADYDLEDDGYGNSDKDKDKDKDDNTIPFPEDVEREKRKRDIH